MKVIPLLPHEHNLLRDLVEVQMVPDGQFIRRWAWWLKLVATFNSLVGRNYSAEELHHYIMTLRKRSLERAVRWAPLGDGCARMPGALYLSLSPNERIAMVEAYVELSTKLGVGADAILVDAAHRKALAQAFTLRTGVGLDDRSLIAAIIDLRKDGLLPRLSVASQPQPKGRAFGDFDAASAM